MKHTPHMYRIAIAALSAALAFPIAPVFGQDAPAASPPPVVTVSPPPPVFVAPPPPVAVAPPPAARRAPPPVAEARPAIRAPRTAAARPRVAAPVRQRAPAPTPAPVTTPAPVAAAPIAPVAALPAPAPAEPIAVPVETPAETGGSMMPWLLAGGALLLALIGFFMWSRRRTADEVDDEAVYQEPVIAAAEPSFTRPIHDPIAAPAAAVGADETEAADADVAALAADSEPVAGRPWLEFLMRPVRAGTSQDDAIVQFELTVGNTGTVSATDVKISTWMFAAGQGSEMERSLIEPPAGATVSEVDIAAGDGARVDGEFALPKSGLRDSILPVVVADARYRLPDGSEGRTSASFAIGMAEGEALMPFPLDRKSGLLEDVEARLHGEPTRT